MPDWIELQPKPLDAARIIAYVTDDETTGGTSVFLGTTRAERNAVGQHLDCLEYEAYPDMALKQLRNLATECHARWPVVRLAILHRLGRVPISEASVIIAVSCPHRGDAFDACRWIIDSLKKDVAIWKKEVWSDGSGTWVHPD